MYSKLDIINAMLASTGSKPLTAEQSRHPSYQKAEATLIRVSKSLQDKKMYFNNEVREVAAQSDGELIVPQNCIAADPTDRKLNYTLRGRRLYNLDTGNYYIGKDVELDMTFNLSLEELPLTALVYIQARAVFEFYLDEDGAEPKLSNYRSARDIGWATLWREHIRKRKSNHFDNPSHATAAMRRGNGARSWRPVVN